jgi:uncharacterized protein (DUF1778 family)
MPRERTTQVKRTYSEKPVERMHSEMLRFRVSPEHASLIREAAVNAGRRKGTGDLSAWIRETLVAAARKELARDEKGGKTSSSAR